MNPLPLLLLLPLSAPQDPSTPPPAAVAGSSVPAPVTAPLQGTVPADLAELALRVEQAHRPKGPVPAVDALQAQLDVQLLDPNASDRGQAELQVRFLDWRPKNGKPRPLIRYEIRQPSGPLVRGHDREGPWHLFQGEPRDLTGEFAQDQKACARDLNLARQLVQFLSPGTVLRALQNPSAVVAEDLPIARGEKVPCYSVTGDLAAFPLLMQGGEDVPVRARIWADKGNHRLLGVDVWPMRAGKPDETRGERILLLELHERDGLLLPRRLEHSFRDDKGQLRPQLRTIVIDANLRPQLRAADFDRKK